MVVDETKLTQLQKLASDFDSLSDTEKVNVYKQASDTPPPIDDLRAISPFRLRVYESA